MRLFSSALLAASFLSLPLQAQTAAPPPINSHQVNPDRTITFRYLDPNAKKVVVATDALAKPLPMAQDASGLWTASTPPLGPADLRLPLRRRRPARPRPQEL